MFEIAKVKTEKEGATCREPPQLQNKKTLAFGQHTYLFNFSFFYTMKKISFSFI